MHIVLVSGHGGDPLPSCHNLVLVGRDSMRQLVDAGAAPFGGVVVRLDQQLISLRSVTLPVIRPRHTMVGAGSLSSKRREIHPRMGATLPQ